MHLTQGHIHLAPIRGLFVGRPDRTEGWGLLDTNMKKGQGCRAQRCGFLSSTIGRHAVAYTNG
jgi:hypothetical protein